jgi:hypothetical protein
VESSPAVADGKVYCLDASTGAQIWKYATGSYVYSSPAAADGAVYVGSADARVYAFAARDGSTDSAGDPKSIFDLMDSVYVRGQGFTADTSVTVCLIPDGAEAPPSNAVADASTTTTDTRDLTVTLMWSQPLTKGEYDLWVDINQNGVSDRGAVWSSKAARSTITRVRVDKLFSENCSLQLWEISPA